MSPQYLIPALRDDCSLEPGRYTFAQIDETAIREELARIYRDASPATKIIYDLAHDPDTDTHGNWIIRWMVWHVFRYRDERNARRGLSSTATNIHGPSNGDTLSTHAPQSAASSTVSRSDFAAAENTARRNPPLVNHGEILSAAQPSSPAERTCPRPPTNQWKVSRPNDAPATTTTRMFYDPVRDQEYNPIVPPLIQNSSYAILEP
jgi:hypothetical protein